MGMNGAGEKGEYIGLVCLLHLQNKNYYILGVQGRTPNWGRFKGRHAFSSFVANIQRRYEQFQTYNLLTIYLSSKDGRISECNAKVWNLSFENSTIIVPRSLNSIYKRCIKIFAMTTKRRGCKLLFSHPVYKNEFSTFEFKYNKKTVQCTTLQYLLL